MSHPSPTSPAGGPALADSVDPDRQAGISPDPAREAIVDGEPAIDRQAEVRRVVVEVAARLAAGLSVDFDRVAAERPDLLPELSDELKLQELTHRQFLAAQRAGPVANDASPGPVARRGGSSGFTPVPMSARLPTGDAPPEIAGPAVAGLAVTGHAVAAEPLEGSGAPAAAVEPDSGIFGRRAAAAASASSPSASSPGVPSANAPMAGTASGRGPSGKVPAGKVPAGHGPAEGVPDIAVQGYRVVAELKRGGQATVFRAIQLATGREVALKVIEGGALLTRRRQSRFDREAEILARLSHPNIVGILDRGRTADGLFFLTMDFIDGPELDEWVAALPRALGMHGETDFPVAAAPDRAGLTGHGRTGNPAAPPARPPDLGSVLRLFVEVCDAVGEAHAQGIVHRDLKPSNVRVDRRRGEPYLLDFGLARLAAADEEEEWTVNGGRLDVTRTGQVMGSLPWLSPEQATGIKATVTARSDVYALGVMLYESLTGVPPYPRDGTLAALLTAIQDHTPEPPGRLRADVSPAVDAVVMTALAKAPADRYADAAAMARDLRAIVEGRPVAAAQYRRPTPWWRRRAAVAAAAVLVVAGTVSVVLATRGGGKGVVAAGPGVSPAPAVAPTTPPKPPPTPVDGRQGGPTTKGVAGVAVGKAPLAATPGDPPSADAGVRIPARQDAFVRDGTAFQKVPQGAPWANARELYRQLAVSTVPGLINKGHTRDAYLEFDLSAIDRARPIRSAGLWLYGRANPSQGWEGLARSAYVSAFRVADPARKWDEKSITFYNRPYIVGYESTATALGSVDVLVGPPRWWQVDLSAFVRAERDKGTGRATVVLHVVDPGASGIGRPDAIATFESGEAEHPPVLVVIYGP